MNRIITILVTIFILLLLYIWISHVWGTDNPRHPKEIVDATQNQVSEDPMADVDTSLHNGTTATPSQQPPVTGDEFSTDRKTAMNSEKPQEVTSNPPALVSKKTEGAKPAVTKSTEPEKNYISNTTARNKTVATATKPTATPSKAPSTATKTTPATKTSSPSTATSSTAGGKHLVIAGNFTQKINAQQRVDELKRAGFKDAEIVNFDLSEYHTVCVGRFSDVNEARKLVKKLKDYHKIDAYVRIGG